MRHLPQHRVMHYPLRCPLHRSSLTRQRGSLPCSDHHGSHSTCALCIYEASLPVNNNCSGNSVTIFGQLLMEHQATNNIMPVLVGTYKSASYQVNRSIHVGGGFSDTECGALQRSHDLGSVAILNLRQKFRKIDGWQCCEYPNHTNDTQNMPRAGNNQIKIYPRAFPRQRHQPSAAHHSLNIFTFGFLLTVKNTSQCVTPETDDNFPNVRSTFRLT